MSEKQLLTRLSYITDDDTGIYKMGEVDGVFSLPELEKYISVYGVDGLYRHLCFLISQVKNAENNLHVAKHYQDQMSAEKPKPPQPPKGDDND